MLYIDATIESLRGELEKAKRLIEILKTEVKSLRERDQAFTSIIPELPVKQRMEASAMQLLSSMGSSGSLPSSSPDLNSKLTHVRELTLDSLTLSNYANHSFIHADQQESAFKA